MSTELMIKQFDGGNVFFMEDGWFNATSAAKIFGKKPSHWLELDEAKDYLFHLSARTTLQQNQLVITRKGSPESGGGTWMHPKLAIPFARWLSTAFAVWCDDQIDLILKSSDINPTTSPLPVLVHPVYGFPVVSLLEDNIHKQVRNSYVETLNRLGLRAPIYKQTLTNNVSRILIGMPIKPFRRLFGIPAGSQVRTRLFMDSNLRRATSQIEETSCFMVNNDRSIMTFEQVEGVVYQVAQIIYQQHLAKGLTLGENVPEDQLPASA